MTPIFMPNYKFHESDRARRKLLLIHQVIQTKLKFGRETLALFCRNGVWVLRKRKRRKNEALR